VTMRAPRRTEKFEPLILNNRNEELRASASFPEKQHYNIVFRRDIVADAELEVLNLLKWQIELLELVEEVFEFKEPEVRPHMI
jgi:hypothetical protein